MRSVNRCIPLAGAARSRTVRGLTAAGLALAALTATASPSQALVGGAYTGSLSVSATTVKVGTTFTATQRAISLGDTQTPGITVGTSRPGPASAGSRDRPPAVSCCWLRTRPRPTR
jgi:hypothetical protein